MGHGAVPGGREDASDDTSSDNEDHYGDESDDTMDIDQFLHQSTAGRSRLRQTVEAGVPCPAHSRRYRGHCNVRTVKDCNYFGLQDEYVVSGSDSGHLFIWVSHALLCDKEPILSTQLG